MDSRGKRKLFIAIALSLFLVVLVIFAAIYGRPVYETLKGLDPKYLLLAGFVYFGIQFAWGVKWFLHVRKVATKADFLYVFTANMMGNFISLTTPSARLAGEPVRAGAVAKRYKVRFSDVFATAMVDKMGLTVGLITVLIPVVWFSYTHYEMPPLLEYLLILFFLFWLVVGLATFLILKSMKHWKADRVVNFAYNVTKFFKGRSPFDRQVIIEKVTHGLRHFRESIKELLKDPVTMTLDVFMAITMYGLRIIAAYILFVAIGVDVTFLVVAVVVMITYIIAMVSQLPGTVGIGEATMTGLYAAMGVAPGPAVTVAFLTQINTYIFELALGYISSWVVNFIGVSKKVRAPS